VNPSKPYFYGTPPTTPTPPKQLQPQPNAFSSNTSFQTPCNPSPSVVQEYLGLQVLKTSKTSDKTLSRIVDVDTHSNGRSGTDSLLNILDILHNGRFKPHHTSQNSSTTKSKTEKGTSHLPRSLHRVSHFATYTNDAAPPRTRKQWRKVRA